MSGDIWNWAYTLEILPVLAHAAIVTIEATLISFVIALVLGLLLAVLRMSGPVVGWFASAFVELVRSTPLLIQIFFIYFVLPRGNGTDDYAVAELGELAPGQYRVTVGVAGPQYQTLPVTDVFEVAG